MLDALRQKAQSLQQQMDAAAQAGNKVRMKQLSRELKTVENSINAVTNSGKKTEETLKNINRASPRELNKALSQLKNELNGIERGSKAWDAQIAKIKAVRAEMESLNDSMNPDKSFWDKINGHWEKYQLAITSAVAVITGLVVAGRSAVNAFAEMEQEMANVRKFTGMTESQVGALNEEFKKMDTRTSREELNQLAQEAGRLGKTSQEDVLGFVRAADKINVALDDLGSGATLTLSKLTGIFGDEQRLGTEKALLSVGSVINELSQNCSASAPYIADFASRMGGVGAQAGMTVQQIMAFAAVLDSNNQNLEASATALSQVIVRIYQDPAKYARVAGMDVQKFSALVKEDMNSALIELLETLKQAGKMDVLSPMFRDMGENGSRAISTLSTLANHIADVKSQQEVANEAFRDAISIDNEFEVQNNTVQASLDKAKKSVKELSVELGEKLQPVMSMMISSSTLMLKALSAMVGFFISYRKEIVTLTVAIGSYYAAIGIAKGLQLAWTAAVTLGTKAVGLFKYAVGLCEVVVIAFTHGLKAAGTAFTFLNQAMKTNAIGLVVSVLATLVMIIKNAVKATDKFTEAFAGAKKAAVDFTDGLVEEQRQIDLLFAKLDVAKKGTKEYEMAKQQIISQYGQYLSGLINERGEITNLAEAYRRLGNMARYAAQQRAIDNAVKQADESYSKGLGDFQNELYESLRKEGKDVREASALSQKVVIELTTTNTLSPETKKLIEQVSKVNFWGRRNKNEDRAPAAIVNDMISLMGAHTEAMGAIEDIQSEQRPFMNWNTEWLEKQASELQKLADEKKGGRVLWGDLGQNPTVKNLSANEVTEWLDQIRWELYTRGAGEAPASKTDGTLELGDGVDPQGDGGAKTGDRFSREKEWKAIQEALALIKKSQGLTVDEQGNKNIYSAYDYTAELDRINVEYYERILKRQDLSNRERIENQAKYEEALAKQRQDTNAKSIDEEDLYHREQLTEIQQAWADNLLTAEQYNKKTEEENVRHLGSVKDLYFRHSETTEEREPDPEAHKKYLDAQSAYLTLVNQIAERERKEAADLAKAHDDQVNKMRDFMLPQEKNDRDYQAELALLDEVYKAELSACEDNAARKLEIEEAYQIAKLALQKKYNQAEAADNKNIIAKSAEWLQSDGGKALVGSMQVIGSGMSEIFSQATSMMQADLESLTAQITKRYDTEISLAEGNAYKTRKLEEQKEKEIAKAKNEANRKMFAMQVIQAIAQTATNAINAYGSAAAIPVVGHVLAPIAASMAVAAGMLQVAAIKKQQQASASQGYMSGGFTPDGPADREAGVVHAGEWVASQKLTKNPRIRPMLEALDYAQRTNTIGSISPDDVSRSITTPVVLASRPEKTQAVVTNNYNSGADPTENRRMLAVLDRLNDRLNEPFVTVNTVTGDLGTKKAQEAYERLMKNKSPKFKK